MPNYQNSRVYKIVSAASDDVYVGSTTQSLSSRMSKHRSNHKGYLAGKYRYTSSYKLLEQGDCHIILLENVSCANKEELHAAERRWIEQLACVNKNIPGRTDAEYYQDNRDVLTEYRRRYSQDNRERINQKHECACGGRFTLKNKTVHLRTKKHQRFTASVPPPAYDLPPVN